jgi:hypothetical protein
MLALLDGGTARAAEGPDCWRELEYAAGNSWASASATLNYLRPTPAAAAAQLQAVPGDVAPLQPGASTALLHARFDAMMSHGELRLWYDSDTNQLLQMLRTGSGRESRRKLHRFLPEAVWRERRAPADPATTAPPQDWPVRSRTLIPRPAGSATLAPLQLIAEAARFAATPGAAEPVFTVLSDTHFYRVRLQSLGERAIAAGVLVQTAGGTRRIDGERSVRRIGLAYELLDGAPGEDPLRLLELEGDLQVAIDVESGLPLRVQGTWMRVGTVPVNLVRARLAADCAR